MAEGETITDGPSTMSSTLTLKYFRITTTGICLLLTRPEHWPVSLFGFIA